MPPFEDADRHLESWPEYRRLVLASLEELSRRITALDRKMDLVISSTHERITKIEIKISVLETKSAFVGALAGVITASIVAILTAWIGRR